MNLSLKHSNACLFLFSSFKRTGVEKVVEVTCQDEARFSIVHLIQYSTVPTSTLFKFQGAPDFCSNDQNLNEI